MKQINNIILKNGIIITPFEKLREKVLFISDKKIEKIVGLNEFESYPENYIDKYRQIDVGGCYISPGFIDIHTHGANGVDANNDIIGPMAEFVVKNGATGFLPTIWTGEFEQMIQACKRINDYMQYQNSGSNVLGINIEGPYLNPNLGAQRSDLVKKPDYRDYNRLIKAGKGSVKIMTIAPELEGAFDLIKYLRANNITVSIGHSDIEIEKMHEALGLGITLVTHLFNAMGDPQPADKGVKATGIQEELMIAENLMCELISDKSGVHVNSTLIKIILKCKGVKNIVLITDSAVMAGLPPGVYLLQDGRKGVLKNGDDVVRILGDNTIFGSVMTINMAIKNFINHTGVKIEEAVQMATYNPAKVINLSHRKGWIKERMDADITAFNNDLDITLTMVEGEIRYFNL